MRRAVIYRGVAELTRAVLDAATDAVADMSASGVSITRNDVQLHTRRQHLEQPTATAEQHRNLVDLQLIEDTGLKRPLRRVARRVFSGVLLSTTPAPARPAALAAGSQQVSP